MPHPDEGAEDPRALGTDDFPRYHTNEFVPKLPRLISVLNRRHLTTDELPEGAVYVGRPSRWGNPFNTQQTESGVIYTREAAIKGFRQYAELRLAGEPHWLDGLRDATALVCWCAPEECHADVLVELLGAVRAPR